MKTIYSADVTTVICVSSLLRSGLLTSTFWPATFLISQQAGQSASWSLPAATQDPRCGGYKVNVMILLMLRIFLCISITSRYIVVSSNVKTKTRLLSSRKLFSNIQWLLLARIESVMTVFSGQRLKVWLLLFTCQEKRSRLELKEVNLLSNQEQARVKI